MKYTFWSAQIDTIVLFTYATIAVFYIGKYFGEIRDSAPSWRRFLLPGIGIAIASMIFDLLSNIPEPYHVLFGSHGHGVYLFVIEIENLCELVAGLLFFVSSGIHGVLIYRDRLSSQVDEQR